MNWVSSQSKVSQQRHLPVELDVRVGRGLQESYSRTSGFGHCDAQNVRAFNDQEWTAQTDRLRGQMLNKKDPVARESHLVGRRKAIDSILVLVGHWESHCETNNAGTPTSRLRVVPDSASFIDNFLNKGPTVRGGKINTSL